MPFEKQNNFDQELKEFWNVNLTGYIMDIKKCLPRDIRSKVEALLATGLFEINGVSLQKIWADVPGFIPLTKEIVDKIHTWTIKVDPPLRKTAVADQLVGKNIKHQPLILDSTEPVPEEEDEEEDDDDIPASWKVPYIDPDDFLEEPSPEPQPDIAPIPADDQYKECPYCHEKCLWSLEEHYDDVHTPKAYADWTPIEKPKQKRNKGRNMKGIEYEITDWEKFYKFVHKNGSIEFIPKDVWEREMDELEWKHVKENTDLEPEPESVQVISTQKPDTTKYDVINPMIMVLNSFEKEQFRKWMKYQYNNTEAVVEERLSKLMLSTDQEYVMNQKLDLLEWYEEDQKKRKEIENFDFFSDDKKEGTKKK